MTRAHTISLPFDKQQQQASTVQRLGDGAAHAVECASHEDGHEVVGLIVDVVTRPHKMGILDL
jgi:hypothetical protein